MKKPLESKVWI